MRRPLRPRAPLATALVATLLATAACGADQTSEASGAAADRSPASSSGPATPSAPSAPSTPSPSPTAARPVTLAFAGDVHFSGRVADLLDDPSTALADVAPHLAGADVAVVNLESAITERGTPEPKKFHFRAPESALQALDSAGVDVVAMANNHTVDYGAVGLRDTLAAKRRSPVPLVGVGADSDEAFAPAYLDVRGTRVAVLSATQVPDWTVARWAADSDSPGVATSRRTTRLVAAVRAARKAADVVVVYLHWGTDYTECPDAAQRETAQALADAGATAVVGGHAHRVQGSGWLESTYVAYGLGNFVWWRRNSEADARSGVLTLTLDLRDQRVVQDRWTPMLVSADGIPRVPDEPERTELHERWQEARGCTGLAGRPG